MVRSGFSVGEAKGHLPGAKEPDDRSGRVEVLFADDGVDEKRWTMLVENSPNPDVYYLPEYAKASAEIERTEPLALITDLSSGGMLAPLLIRRASATASGSTMDWLDAGTPYGYGGLLKVSSCAPAETLHSFFRQLNDWCASRGIVCCVIRLHPLLDKQNWADMAGPWQDRLKLHSRGPTYSIGLSEWNMRSDRPVSLRRDRLADMRLASRTLRIVWGTGADDDIDVKLGIFTALYHQLIDRNRAGSFYRFPQSYFEKLAKLGERLGVALAMHGNDAAGANLFLRGSQYAHGHLAATNDLGRRYGASTLLNIEGARWARQFGCELLHLGGGLAPGDSLEEFKRSFGGPTHTYRYMTFVADPHRYEIIQGLPHPPWPYNLASTTTVEADSRTTT